MHHEARTNPVSLLFFLEVLLIKISQIYLTDVEQKMYFCDSGEETSPFCPNFFPLPFGNLLLSYS